VADLSGLLRPPMIVDFTPALCASTSRRPHQSSSHDTMQVKEINQRLSSQSVALAALNSTSWIGRCDCVDQGIAGPQLAGVIRELSQVFGVKPR